MKLFLVFFFIGTLCSCIGAEKKSFDGYKVYRLTPTSQEQIDVLINMEDGENDYDFWNRANTVGNPIDIMVSPKDQESFLKLMTAAGMSPEVLIKDVQELISMEYISDGLGQAGMEGVDSIKIMFNEANK